MKKNKFLEDTIEFNFEEWHKLQCDAKTIVTAELAAKYLVEKMQKANNLKDRHGFLSKVYQTVDNQGKPFFFFYDYPIRQTIIEYLFENELLEFDGKTKHQGTLHSTWTISKRKTSKSLEYLARRLDRYFELDVEYITSRTRRLILKPKEHSVYDFTIFIKEMRKKNTVLISIVDNDKRKLTFDKKVYLSAIYPILSDFIDEPIVV